MLFPRKDDDTDSSPAVNTCQCKQFRPDYSYMYVRQCFLTAIFIDGCERNYPLYLSLGLGFSTLAPFEENPPDSKKVLLSISVFLPIQYLSLNTILFTIRIHTCTSKMQYQ